MSLFTRNIFGSTCSLCLCLPRPQKTSLWSKHLPCDLPVLLNARWRVSECFYLGIFPSNHMVSRSPNISTWQCWREVPSWRTHCAQRTLETPLSNENRNIHVVFFSELTKLLGVEITSGNMSRSCVGFLLLMFYMHSWVRPRLLEILDGPFLLTKASSPKFIVILWL